MYVVNLTQYMYYNYIYCKCGFQTATANNQLLIHSKNGKCLIQDPDQHHHCLTGLTLYQCCYLVTCIEG